MRVAPKDLLIPSLALMLCLSAGADQLARPPSSTEPIEATDASSSPEPVEATTAPEADQTPPAAQAPATPPKPPAAGPLQIKVSDTVNFRLGALLQPQADFQQGATKGTSSNLMLRRVRFILSGQVAKPVFFFFQTENSRLGGSIGTAGKVTSSGFQTVDADVEYRYSKPLNLWAGLIYLPTTREALKASGSEFMIDTNTYTYTATTALAGTLGRDTGFMARGYFLADRLEYRAGLFAGLRDAASRNPFRKIARVQYNVFDTELYNMPSYPGAYFGAKKILAIGAALDGQRKYRGYTADVFADLPTSFGSALGTATLMRLDGKNFLTALPKSDIFVIDGGVFMKGSKLGPWARYEQRNFASPNGSRNEKRYLVGLNYYLYGNNLNIKTAAGQLKPSVGKNQNQFTVQLQVYYY